MNSRLTRSILALCTLLGICHVPPSALGFSIAAPSEMAVLEPGEQIPVRIDLGGEIGIRRVGFYWYHEGEEPLSSRQARPGLVASSSSDPPFGGLLTVPEDGIGIMRLLAVGEVARGRLAGREAFDEILIRVEPSAELLDIEFAVEKPWRVRTIGRILSTPALGSFADGVVRPLGGASAGSVYRSSDDWVIGAHSNGLLRVMGNGRARLTVENRGKRGTLEILVKGDEEPNEWPIADAGRERTVKSGQIVALSGLNSLDPDGDPLQYRWAQVRGHKVPLLDPDTARPRFVAPKVSQKRLLQFRLRVTDMEGADTVKGADSLPAYVDVWVLP